MYDVYTPQYTMSTIMRYDWSMFKKVKSPSGLGSMEPIQLDSTADRVVEAIRNSIIRGELRPGDKVPEQELASQLGISRTPVREAIRMLEQQGLLRVESKKGTYVAAVDKTDEQNALSVRATLEELAINEAIERLSSPEWKMLCDSLEKIIKDMETSMKSKDSIKIIELDIEFHTLIVSASRNPYLVRTWHLVGFPYLIWKPEMNNYKAHPENISKDPAEKHMELLRAIKSKNLERIKKAIASHIMRKLEEIDEI